MQYKSSREPFGLAYEKIFIEIEKIRSEINDISYYEESRKICFPYIVYNGIYMTAIQIEKLPYRFAPDVFINKITKENGIPFVIYRDNDITNEELLRMAIDNEIFSTITGMSKEEVEDETLTIDKRINLCKELLHRAMHGFIIKANSKNALYETFEKIKSELKKDKIDICNMYINDYDHILYLENTRVINDELSDKKYKIEKFMFKVFPKQVTQYLSGVISKLEANRINDIHMSGK